MSWTWTYVDRDGKPVDGSQGGGFGTQADAETWLGQNWRDLLDQGVASVTLCEESREVYGPMSLDPEA